MWHTKNNNNNSTAHTHTRTHMSITLYAWLNCSTTKVFLLFASIFYAKCLSEIANYSAIPLGFCHSTAEYIEKPWCAASQRHPALVQNVTLLCN